MTRGGEEGINLAHWPHLNIIPRLGRNELHKRDSLASHHSVSSHHSPVGRQRRVVVAVVPGGGGRERGPGRRPRRHVCRPGAGGVALKAEKKKSVD